MAEVTIPPELENLLLEFTIHTIMAKPDDLVTYAADYFAKLRDHKQSVPDEGSEQYIADINKGRGRRGTVMGESYNPEEDDDGTDVETYPKTDEQRNRIKQQSEGIFLFRVLDEVDFSAVIDAMQLKHVEEGDIVIQQGDDGDYFYLIDNGTYDVFIKDGATGEDKYVASYDNNGFFGELALLHNQPRAATIKATSVGDLWAVGRTTFNKLIVKRAFQKRQIYMKLLDGTPQLTKLTEYEKMQVADALVGKSYQDRDVIVAEGDEGDGMYFIVEGKVSVRKRMADGEKEITELREGEFFGEMALVKHQPRAATVAARGEVKAAFLDVKAFERLLGPAMDIMERHIDTYK